MTDVVPQDIDIDEKLAKQAIEEAFGFSVASINLLGEGWDNLVYKVNSNLIFRFSRRKVAIPLLIRECKVLQVLADKLPLSIPHPKFCSEGTSAYPHPFYGHYEVLGETGCLVELTEAQYHAAAFKLALFLKELHSLKVKDFQTKEDPMQGVFDRAEVEKMQKFFLERLESVKKSFDLSAYEAKISRILAEAKSYKPNKENPVFVHGDLYHRHLIFSKGGDLTGVIDWGDCCVTDPVVDLSVLYQFFPESVHKDFLKFMGRFQSLLESMLSF